MPEDHPPVRDARPAAVPPHEMTRPSPWTSSALVLAAPWLAVWTALPAAATPTVGPDPEGECGGVRPGDRPTYRFGSPILGGPGIVDLEDLRGRPVLVDYWGTRCAACVQLSVPAALELAEEHGEDLVVLLVESQSASAEEIELFAYGRGWMETPVLWTGEAPFRPASRGLPAFVLLSAEGEVVLSGNSIDQSRELEQAVAEEVERARRGPDGVSRAVRRLYADFAEGRYAAAVQGAERALESERDAAPARAALEHFGLRLDRLQARAERLVAAGCYLDAEALLRRLQEGVRGLPGREAPVAELLDGLDCPEVEAQLEAERALARVLARARAKGFEPAVVRDLERHVQRYPGATCTEQARRLLDMVRS